MSYFGALIKNIHIWGFPLLIRGVVDKLTYRQPDGPIHILFCMVDHFEPAWNNADLATQRNRVKRWVDLYPDFASSHRDSNGRHPQHTWFYAAEEYLGEHLDQLTKLCGFGLGEIELHLHHENDTAEGFREKLEKAKKDFSQHGALVTSDNPPKYTFGFIHGNWALNNSRRGLYCGVDNELRILREAGCYADFTLPSAPDESQTQKVNSIYYATDIPERRKSHNSGPDVRMGRAGSGDLLLIQGPLGLNWRRRKLWLFPRIENGCVQRSSPGLPDRIDLWIKQHVHVKGRPEWVFVKVHCHGAQEDDVDTLLGAAAHMMFSYLEKGYNDGERFRLHYVTARELYNIVNAAEAGLSDNPFEYRDYKIQPYRCSGEE